MVRSPGLSKTKAVERAIDHYVKEDAYRRARELRGAFPDWVDHAAAIDRADRERQEGLDRLRRGEA